MERLGRDPPAELIRLEELEEGLWPSNRGAWRAFGELSGGRSMGFGVGAIPLTEIEAWFRLHRRLPESLLVTKIQLIDGAFLVQQSKDQAATAAAKPKPKGK